jgi:hypothetical protein
VVTDTCIKESHWLAGFVEAEGCFDCAILPSKPNKTGTQVFLRFTLVQHLRDYKLINKFVSLFNCGIFRLNSKYASYTVNKFSDIQNKIIPLFKEYTLQGSKLANFKDFCKIAELMDNNLHLTEAGVEEIVQLRLV